MKIFLDNKRKIVEHNRRYEMKEVNYKLGMNKYGDMVSSEKWIVWLIVWLIMMSNFLKNIYFFLIVASRSD